MRKRLFVDMDGTLAEFKNVDTLEVLYEQGYFKNLKPQINVVEAIKEIINKNEVEVFILSAVLSDSKYALGEKNEWIDKFLPEIDKYHRIFPPCGEDKKNHIPEGIRVNDFLLDDYTHNLMLWSPPAEGIKLLNGINHTRGTWKGSMLSFNKSSAELAKDISSIVLNDIKISHSVGVTMIDGHNCVKVDEWQNGTASYVLGRVTDSTDGEWYFTKVVDADEELGGTYIYEHGEKLSRSEIEEKHIDRLSEIDLNRHEAEYGADGSRAFPHLNDVPPQIQSQEINEKSDNIKIEGHSGTWYVIETETINGSNLFLLESEQYGDEAASLIVDGMRNIILDDVYNGFDDYREKLLLDNNIPSFDKDQSGRKSLKDIQNKIDEHKKSCVDITTIEHDKIDKTAQR